MSSMSDVASSKSKGSEGDIRLLRRPVAPASTQLYIVRTMLESMLSDRAGAKKTTIRKELDANTLSEIEKFIRMSYFWPSLLRFTCEFLLFTAVIA